MPIHRPSFTTASRWLAAIMAIAVVAGCSPSGAGGVAAAVGTPGPTEFPGALVEATATSAPSPLATPSFVARVPAANPSGSPTPSTTPTSSPEPTPATPEATGPYETNLYRKGDFVSQATKDQCVSAAMQIMLNVVATKADRTKATQTRLARLATRLSEARDGGTEPLGWARGLERRGAGAYEVVVEPTMGRAVRRAVEAIRATGRPVGLLVWRGAHSWVLHGFETTADPATTSDYRVSGLWVSDPWYPRISSIWGGSRKPNQRITVKQLREDYLAWRRPTGRYPGMDGRYVLVVPVVDRG